MDLSGEVKCPLTDETIIRKPTRKGLTLELVMFTFFLGKTFSDMIIVNLLERNTCLVILEFREENCTDPVSPSTEGLVQQSTANIIMARSMIEAFVPSLLSLFIGPWSDTNGRLPLILLSLTGYIVSTVMWCVMSLFPQLHPMYFLLTSVPVALGGGYVSFFLALYCYISDTTKEDQRAFRMGLAEASCMAGVLCSSLLTPYVLNTSPQFGYTIVFALGTSLMMLIFLFVYFFLKESVNVVESERTKLWKIDHVKEIFTTCFLFRPNHIRTIVMCIIINLVLFIVNMDGELAVLYMFTQKKFNWQLEDYTRFTSFLILVAGSSVIGSLWLLVSVLKMPDLPLMFVGTVCLVCKSLLQAIATSSVYLYIAGSFSVLSVLVTPLSRSQLSKLIPPEDLGKIFAFTAFLEATAPLMAAPLYGFVYKATIDTYPNAVFWLSTGLCLISVFLIGSVLVLHRRVSLADQRPLLVNDDKEETSVET
ncbi:solute carrier family 46 member 3-like [Macrosteles quadrilineatus]|uniref:solute carrier family 46 member 3-like n=1 Tax=Macrosteles quadrilineatus TaxID=74068 RepID=UPI0023E28F32|nr:solute carrier family 46 member 3-like [Macrosteles quadrilineatus]